MAGRSSDGLLRQVHRIVNLGAVGTLTDAQLLDWFVSRRDEAAEAAFEELMNRHGPMVFRVCRSVLRDRHDAEDAFQAAFLVLAHRAGAIRRRGSVASWLFGVAHRVSSRARTRSARRRALDQKAAELTPEAHLPEGNDSDWEILHQEVDRLPDRLRAPVVLCYLEGLTYDAAAHQLKLSEGAFRGRLAQARERLRRRLTGRGVTIPAGLLVAGAVTASPAQAAIPPALIHSTIRIAMGFMAGSTAAVLARGVLRSMLINQLKVAMVLVLLGVGSGYGLWHASGAGIKEKGHGQAGSGQAVGKTAGPPPGPQRKAAGSTARFTGTVKVEGTGQPVAGAKLRIMIGGLGSPTEKIVETGADGRFAIDLPAGNIRVWLSDLPAGFLVSGVRQGTVWLSDLPAGFLVSGVRQGMEDLELPADRRETHREYAVRKGTIWSFQFVRGSDRRPFRGLVATATTTIGASRAQGDDRGRASLTLPTEGPQAELAIWESDPLTSQEIQTGLLRLSLKWDSGFRPDELEDISRLEGNKRRFRLVDADARSAVLQAPELVEPVKEEGKLVFRVTVPYRDAKDHGALTGQVLDEQGTPVAGAQVSVWGEGGSREMDDLRHRATTDPQGRYRLRDIPRRAIDGQPLQVRLIVTRYGFAGIQTPFLPLTESSVEKPQVVESIRLERGVSLSGIVVDHRGRPVAEAIIRPNQPAVLAGSGGTPRAVQTDEGGRFVIDGVRRGVVQFFVFHGKLRKSNHYLADGSAEVIRIKLPDPAEDRPPDFAALRAPPLEPRAVGQPAPEWQVGPWSDGRTRTLADQHGKVVVLYFWGISFWPSVGALPAMGQLATRFQPRGVEFLAIHNVSLDEEDAREQGRKVLAFKGAPLVMAIDRTRVARHARGVTLQAYGGEGYPLPVIIVIDRAGKIAYRSDTATGDRNMYRVFTRIFQDPGSMTEQQVNERVERRLAEEIEKALTTN
jgi:RNA polymerase sigma factor (sigma-70 family)